MLIFIIGPSGSGKSSCFAPSIQEALKKAKIDSNIIEAGGWVRNAIEKDPEETLLQRLVGYSQETLKKDRNVAISWIQSQLTTNIGIICGIRNPFDFGALFDWTTDLVIWIEGPFKTSFEEEGIKAININISWLKNQGIPVKLIKANEIQDVPLEFILHEAQTVYPIGNILKLPERISVTIDGRMLGVEGLLSGWLIALECYYGQKITGMFHDAVSGGTFHDVSLDEFRIAPETGFLNSNDEVFSSYGNADRGSPVIESSPLRQCTIYNQNRIKIGEGESIAMLHFPSGNTLYHLIKSGERLLLWPPHKLLFGRDGELPKWKKL